MEISIGGAVSSKLGLASHQNSVPLLRLLTISNGSDKDFDDLTLELEPSLPFFAPKTWRVDHLARSSTIQIPNRDVVLKDGYLADLSESMNASVQFRLRSATALLAEQSFPVELLARNEWGGARSMPELLAAFCTPNDPSVDKVLKSASNVLRRAGRPDGIDGYTTKSRQRVWELASAIWSAICGYKISYAVPPASFEREGQKIRTPAQIMDGGVGTCLDTALLFAAALEQAGLNPIVALTGGHAFSGVWLQPQEFADVLTDDVSALRKRIELQELLVFETTLATQSAAPAFSHAIDTANRQLTDEGFVIALDVRRARMQQIRPLAVSAKVNLSDEDDSAPRTSEALESAPELPGFDVVVEELPVTPAGKLELWQRKLLDLTTRNRLLHLPDRAKAIHLVCPDPAGLEDLLSDNKSVRIVPMPLLEVAGRDSQIYQQRNQENLEEEFSRRALTRSEVPSKMEKEKLDAALVDLYRSARSDLEEGGSNTLFLAIGFLRWKKAEDDPKSYFAPLILLPVKLERRSIVSGVKMSMLDDEPRFNLTLLELLRHDFRLNINELTGDLPTDESGIDVDSILNIVRRAVRDMEGFEVTTDVVLGTFSFAKYLMWRDLIDRTDQLTKNDVVRHLLHHKLSGQQLESAGEFPEPRTLDQEISPGDLFTPLPIDSSQLAAVVASARGHSFVLDGPPGTGKSQTIANMIAHNLALGRRVLFVAEKMAALDVVKRRLDEKGVGQFCLELHSSKSSKLHVIKQLDRAWISRGDLTQQEWSAEAERVRILRDRLNAVVAVLHKRWPNGWSVHEAIGRVVRDATPLTPRFSWHDDVVHDHEQMARLRDVARRLDLNRAATEGPGAQMTLLARTEWSNAWQESVVACARRVVETLTSCDDARSRMNSTTGLSFSGTNPDMTGLLRLVSNFPDAHGIDLRFAFSTLVKTVEAAGRQVISLLHEYETLNKRLSQPYAAESIRRIDVEKLKADWTEACSRFWFLATLAKNRVARSLAGTAGTADVLDVAADLPRLEAMKVLIGKLEGLEGDVRDVPGWSGIGTNTGRMAFALKLSENLRTSLAQLAASPDQLVQMKRELQRLLIDGNELLAPDGPIAKAVRTLTKSDASLKEITQQFATLANCPINLTQQAAELRITALGVIDNEFVLKACCDWRRVREEALAIGLGSLVEAVEQGKLANGSVSESFEVAYARWFAAKIIDAEPLLRNFVPAEHQSDIHAYTTAEDRLGTLTSAYIRAKLSGAIPDKNSITPRSGFGVLKHELQKSRRHKPVRQLAQEMGDAFAALAPCMLMSPLSIAQYLPANHELFDLVIFDEASQIAPWDAIGSIARGKQVVIAGDPRQMPPTSFFSRGTTADDDDTDEDLESILDECLGAGIPQHSLTWHYRSRHESLITFSNYRYYGGSLITFPAADTRPSAVEWRKVDGVYARGKGRHNEVEAKAIVNEVIKRLTSPSFIASNRSIGIITLNAEQQRLVDDLLDDARRTNPSIEPFFSDGLAEPVVVKNLETMQGDERDVIILGIGFGPTEPGANVMSMNFGPLNREGGWRRLNVALTRARQEMLIFTSFDPSMIDFNRTSARAVQDLRHFIEFAHQGPSAIPRAIHGSIGGFESPFEQFVAEGLRAKGWETHPQIGVSRFRIDLGVVHPDRPGDYLVGVECDGATYHSAATARDRDKIRSEILRGLGWRLVRVWSTEWWVDREGALERLHQAISSILKDLRTTSAALEAAKVKEAAAVASAIAAVGDAIAKRDAARREDNPNPQALSRFVGPAEIVESDAAPSQLVARGSAAALASPTRGTYRMARFPELEPSLRPELFQDASYDATLETLMRRILEQEAPLLDKLLVDRVARAHGFKRSGRIIRERVLDLAERHYHFRQDPAPDSANFIWLSVDDPERWNCYRIPASDDDVRYIEEIALEELAVASLTIRGDDLPVEVARLFNVRRLSSSARTRIVAAASRELRAPHES